MSNRTDLYEKSLISIEEVFESPRMKFKAENSDKEKPNWENDKPTVMALREIAEGYVTNEFIAEQDIVHEDPVFAAFEDESTDD